jgi:hypothetical protein
MEIQHPHSVSASPLFTLQHCSCVLKRSLGLNSDHRSADTRTSIRFTTAINLTCTGESDAASMNNHLHGNDPGHLLGLVPPSPDLPELANQPTAISELVRGCFSVSKARPCCIWRLKRASRALRS